MSITASSANSVPSTAAAAGSHWEDRATAPKCHNLNPAQHAHERDASSLPLHFPILARQRAK